MGQTPSSTTAPVGSVGNTNTSSFLQDLAGSDLLYEKSLGQSRFLKAIRTVHRPTSSRIVVKIRVSSDGLQTERYARRLKAEQDRLASVPHALPYTRVVSSANAGFLLRQWIAYNLYDRISTRPFLTQIEKQWIAFQLLTALRDCHAHKIAHGDIKSENVLCTTSNRVYLADFATFKPTFLPLDDPADFAYFFDASGRRVCNLAPERFYDPKLELPRLVSAVTEAMDVFALGCVIAELCSDGQPTFSLSQLFQYRRREYTPDFSRIENQPLRRLIISMIAVNPDDRLTCSECLSQYRSILFPDVFYRLEAHLTRDQSDLAERTHAESHSQHRVSHDGHFWRLWTGRENIDTILTFSSCVLDKAIVPVGRSQIFPIVLPSPFDDILLSRCAPTTDDPGSMVILSVVLSDIRNYSRPATASRAIEFLLVLAVFLTDTTRLDRIVPFMVSLLDDASALVRVSALKCMTQLLSMIDSVTPANAKVFTDYILPNITPLGKDTEEIVRATYAQCLPPLTDFAARLLDLSRTFSKSKLEQLAPDVGAEESYDSSMQRLQIIILEQALVLLVDPSTFVKRTFLRSLAPLCVFLGRNSTADALLSHSITYLNDLDWSLRAAFFEVSISLSACVGGKSVEQYIIPLMMQALVDAEDFVVTQVLTSVVALVEIGLVTKAIFWDIVEISSGLLCHPNAWIRQGAAALLAAGCKSVLAAAETWCLLYPVIRPSMKEDVAEISENSLLCAAISPLSATTFNSLIAWTRECASESQFWHGHGVVSADDVTRLKSLLSNDSSVIDIHQIGFLQPYLLKKVESNLQSVVPHSDHRIPFQTSVIPLQSISVIPENVFFSVIRPQNDQPAQETGVQEHTHRLSRPSNNGMPNFGFVNEIKPVDNPQRHLANLAGSVVSSSYSESDLRHDITSPPPSDHVATMHPIVTFTEQVDRPPQSERVQLNARKNAHSSATLARQDVTAQSTMNEIVPPQRDTFEAITAGPSFTTTYSGVEPGIRRLLELTYDDASVGHVPEIGPRIGSSARRQRSFGAVPRAHCDQHRDKRMLGTLVAHFQEHAAAVTTLAASPDNLFFVSGSKDATIRIWDTMRLEKRPSARSRLVFRHAQRITSICILDSPYCIISASADGVINMNRVDVDFTSPMPRYVRGRTIRQTKIAASSSDFVQCMTACHSQRGYLPQLICGTVLAKIIIIDLHSMRQDVCLQNDTHLGPITAILTDQNSNWALAGTALGHLCLWDLRFRLLLRTWRVAPGTVRFLLRHPLKGKNRWVFVAADYAAASRTLFEVWDVEKGKIVETYGTGTRSSTILPKSRDVVSDPESDAYTAVTAFSQETTNDEDLSISSTFALAVDCAQADTPNSSSAASLMSLPADSSRLSLCSLLSAGSDLSLRLWDLTDVSKSRCLLTCPNDPPSHFTSVRGPVPQHFHIVGRRSRRVTDESLPDQQARMKGLRDAITALSVLAMPFHCIVIGDREGGLRVYA